MALFSDGRDPIPPHVYYSNVLDNFYSTTHSIAMDGEFYLKWVGRRGEFPRKADPVKPPAVRKVPGNFQARVWDWMQACFGYAISMDGIERNHRFFEESTELVQAKGMTREEAHQLVDYVYNRPVGEVDQEVGGVMVTLAALCLADGTSMMDCGETELSRIWTKVDQIRAKQANKPKFGPLPE